MKYTRINLMCPTYKRVSNGKLVSFIDSAIDKADDKNQICFTFLGNHDDTETINFFSDYCYGKIKGVDFDFICDKPGKPNLARYFNKMYEETIFKAESTLVSMLGDDMQFITKGYDIRILKKANGIGGFGIIYADDDYIQHEKLCVNLFTFRRFIRATGKPFMCNLYACDWIDTMWMYVTNKTGTAYYLPDIVIQHAHATRVGEDATYQRLREEYVDVTGDSQNKQKFLTYANEIIRNIKLNQ